MMLIILSMFSCNLKRLKSDLSNSMQKDCWKKGNMLSSRFFYRDVHHCGGNRRICDASRTHPCDIYYDILLKHTEGFSISYQENIIFSSHIIKN